MPASHRSPKFVLREETKLLHASSLIDPILDIGCSSSDRLFRSKRYISLDLIKRFKPTIVADAHKLPFKDASINTVLCLALLEHTEKHWIVLTEVERVLAKNGELIVSVPFLYPIHDWQDFTRFTTNYFEKNLGNFKIIVLKKQFSGLMSTVISWAIPLTYDLPFVIRHILQFIIRIILSITKCIDIRKDLFYAHISICAKKIS